MIRKIVFFILFPIAVSAQLSIPEHGGVWVHDDAHILSSETRSQLEYMLQSERDSTTNQIAVLIVPTLEGESLEDYSIRVVEKWKLGKKDRDNGVLLMIAIKERKVRIEVGEGLEGVLTDALTSRIIRNEISPLFQQGDYNAGIQAGVMSIIHGIKGEYVNNDPPVRGKRSRSPWTTLIFIIILIIAVSRRRGGGGLGGMWVAGSLLGSGMGGGSSSSGSDYGGGGSFGGGGSSGSW